MIPILFEKTEKNFTSQGLGSLTDAISCSVTEERNGEFELEMKYPISGLHYADIAYSRYILAVPADGEAAQPFEIYKISRPIGGTVTISARHISYQLSYIATIPVGESTSAQNALNSLKTGAASTCPFTFTSDVTQAGTFSNKKVQTIRALLGGQTGSILDVYGGEYKWDKWNVSLLDNRGSTLPVTIEYGKNLTDLTQEENIESTYTAVIAMWSQEQDGVTTTVYSDIAYTDNKDAFPYVRTLIVDNTSDYQEAPTKAQLTEKAKQYIKANKVGVPKVSLTISFVNLRDTEEYKNVAPLQRINLCDTIKVKFPELGVDASAKVIKTVYDVLNEKYTSLEIGEAKTNLATTIADIVTDYTDEITAANARLYAQLESDLERATALIAGGLGGYVVIRKSESTGYPEEILIMDMPDKSTAKNVIRLNKNGIGFSQNGYNGPFNSAWTIDGVFNAQYIGTGTLSAVTMQTAKPTENMQRLAIEKETSAIKGFTSGGTLINLIDMVNGNTTGANMVIDAKNMLAIRTPKIGVTNVSAGTGSAEVKTCITQTGAYVTNITKNMGDSEHQTWEGYVFGDTCYCTLPVYLNVTYSDTGFVNGLAISHETAQTEVV